MTLSLAHISSLVLIAGVSGAGKSTALDTLADSGWYAVDNLPVAFFRNFIEFTQSTPDKFDRTALHVDIDSREKQESLLTALQALGDKNSKVQILFLECKTETILKRYAETRRPHPGFDAHKDKSLEDAIQRERIRLAPLKHLAHMRVDTSNMTIHDLRREVRALASSIAPASAKTVRINFLSFGFKFGVPLDCDMIMDVRFLPNPHFMEALREKTGLDSAVADFVLTSEKARDFIARYVELLNFLIPEYVFEGKSYLNIGIGCTGGRHRSVTIAEALCARITPGEYLLSVKHRDIERTAA